MNHIKISILGLLLVFAGVLAVAQQAPTSDADREPPRDFSTYDELFDDFEKRRDVLHTRLDRMVEQERVEPADIERLEGQLRELDTEYARALERYISRNPTADDLMPARHELVVTLSRLEGRFDDALRAADTFLEHHADSELVSAIRFLKAQTLFRVPGRERDALAAYDDFLEHHEASVFEAGAVRTMRVRTFLFLDRVADARRALRAILDSEEVAENEDAREFLQEQLGALDWVGRELPNFDLRDTEGNRVSRQQFAGKPLLLFVWDSTSGTALGELPFVAEAQRRFGDNMNILGININESRVAFEQWLERNQERVQFPNVWIDRFEESSLLKRLDVTLMPFNILVDRDGRIHRYDVRSDDLLRYAEIMTRAD
jgi:hypothetical protein